MPPESLPIHKIPDTPEFRAAAAQYDKEQRDKKAKRPQESAPIHNAPDTPEFRAAAAQYDKTQRDKMRNVVIIPPEKAAEMRAQLAKELEKARNKIKDLQ